MKPQIFLLILSIPSLSVAAPLGYRTSSWDFGWLMLRRDGHLARWLCNPYALQFEKSTTNHSMRWFVSR